MLTGLRIGVWLLITCLFGIGCNRTTSSEAMLDLEVAQRGPQNQGRSMPSLFDAKVEDPTYSHPALLWNGLVGVRLSRLASGYAEDGSPLPAFHHKEYDPDGEEKIRALPNPLGMKWQWNRQDLGSIGNYSQTMDFERGILVTGWTHDMVEFTVETALHPSAPILAQRWLIVPRKEGLLTLRSGFTSELKWTGPESDGRSTLGPTGMEVGLRHRASSGVWEPVRGGYQWTCRLEPAVPATLYRVVTWGRSANQVMFDDIFAETVRVWRERWETDIVIEGPTEDQQAIRSFLYYLRSAIQPGAGHSVAPFGLGDATYNGHVFWDADVWVMPALMLLDPPLAKEIADYRIAKVPGAKEEFRTWFKGMADPDAETDPPDGIKYPWESSVSGRETVPGPSRLQHHISPTVVWSLERANALGLVSSSDLQRVGRGVAAFLELRTKPEGDQRVFLNTMSPDEHHTGDNDLYTNLLTEHVLRKYSTAFAGRSPLEGGQQGLMKLPRDEKGYLTYDNDRLRGYKQAAAELAIYPLQFTGAIAESDLIMERIAPKVIKNGPAMTESIHAIVEARHGDVEKAYEAWRSSWHDFTYIPLNLFTEKRTKAVSYFTTGAAGSLQAVLFGFLGIHLGVTPPEDASWRLPLQSGYWLWGTKGTLPSKWKAVTVKGLQVLGKRYTLTVDANGSRLEAL